MKKNFNWFVLTCRLQWQQVGLRSGWLFYVRQSARASPRLQKDHRVQRQK